MNKFLAFFSLLFLIHHGYCSARRTHSMKTKNENINFNNLKIRQPNLNRTSKVSKASTTTPNPNGVCLVYLSFDEGTTEDYIGQSSSVVISGMAGPLEKPDSFTGQYAFRFAGTLTIDVITPQPNWISASFCFATAVFQGGQIFSFGSLSVTYNDGNEAFDIYYENFHQTINYPSETWAYFCFIKYSAIFRGFLNNNAIFSVPNTIPVALNSPTTTAIFGGNNANFAIDQVIFCEYAISYNDMVAVYTGSYAAYYAGLVPETAVPYPIPDYTNAPLAEQTPGVQCGHNQYWDPVMGIVGGTEAKEFEFPSQVVVSNYCGGTIINANWVVTAAHCCEDPVADYKIYYKIRVNQTLDDQTADVRNAVQVIKHPDYDPVTVDNDFCLIQVDVPFDFSNPIEAQPACLPTDCSTEKCIPGEDTLIVGLGAIYSGGPLSFTLLKTYQVIMDDTVCNAQYPGWDPATGRYLCAWIPDQGMADTCQGDSGGPLFCYKNGYFMVQGLTSWGDGCGDKPGVYADLCADGILSWIDTTMNP